MKRRRDEAAASASLMFARRLDAPSARASPLRTPGEPLFEPRLELSDLRVQFGLQSFHALLELRIETREIELVQVSEISPICRIDHVEPLHELVGEVVPELLVEFARQSGRDRHGSSRRGVPSLIVGSARYGIKKTRLSSTPTLRA